MIVISQILILFGMPIGQLGLGESVKRAVDPRQVEFDELEGDIMANICSSGQKTVVVSALNKIYLFGHWGRPIWRPFQFRIKGTVFSLPLSHIPPLENIYI